MAQFTPLHQVSGKLLSLLLAVLQPKHYTLHCTLCTAYSALHTLHCTQCTLDSEVHKVDCTQCNALSIENFSQCTAHYRHCTVNCSLSTVHCTLFTVHCTSTAECIVSTQQLFGDIGACNVDTRGTLYCPHCTVYSALYTVDNALGTV